MFFPIPKKKHEAPVILFANFPAIRSVLKSAGRCAMHHWWLSSYTIVQRRCHLCNFTDNSAWCACSFEWTTNDISLSITIYVDTVYVDTYIVDIIMFEQLFMAGILIYKIHKFAWKSQPQTIWLACFCLGNGTCPNGVCSKKRKGLWPLDEGLQTLSLLRWF